MTLLTIKGTVLDRSFIRDYHRAYHVYGTDGMVPGRWYWVQLKPYPFNMYLIHRLIEARES